MSVFSRAFHAALIAATVLTVSVVARADCPGFPECARDHCDPVCCFGSGFSGGTCETASDGNEFCTTGGCIVDTYCWPPCLAAHDDAGVKTDGGYDVVIPDAGYDVVTPDTPPFDSGGAPDTRDDLPAEIPNDHICYVFVHGSEPTNQGPAAKSAPASTYWGTMKPDDPLAGEKEGEFIHAVIDAAESTDTIDLPGSEPDGKRWAAVTYDGTWPFYWASLDVLQQLETIENGGTPVSLEYVYGDDKQLGYHRGVNYCKKDDWLVTIGHSMGNLVVAFLLENFHSDDLNYDFLRTGGLSADAPFYDPSKRAWIDKKDPKSIYNNLKPATDTPMPWEKPARFDPETKKEIAPSPHPDREECYFPPPGDATPYHFPYVDAKDGWKGIGVCRGDPGTRTVGQIVERIAYHYSIAGPFRGTQAADCLCQNGYPSDAPSICKLARTIADAPVIGAGPDLFGKAFCNPALESMQSGSAYLMQYMGSNVGRHVYLYAGTDPTAGKTLAFGITVSINPIDCLANGDPDECRLTSKFGRNVSPDGYPQPMNDTAVPISSAMACDVEIWSTAAKLGLSTTGGAAFSRGMCGWTEKIWPGWATNDTVFAMAHMAQRAGAVRREAYATPDSFWTHVLDVTTTRHYVPGAPLIFGWVGEPPFPECFHKPNFTQANKIICSKTDEASYFDRREQYEGCGGRCKSAGSGTTIIRDHRSMGHVIAIEERYVERRAREF